MKPKAWNTKSRARKSEGPRLILPRTPEFKDAVDRLAEVIKPASAIPNGFDAPMTSDARHRTTGTATRVLEMASELGLIGVSVERYSPDVADEEGMIVLLEEGEEA